MKCKTLKIALLSLGIISSAYAQVPQQAGFVSLMADISKDIAPHDNISQAVRANTQNDLPTLNLSMGGTYWMQEHTWEGWEVNLFYQRAVNYNITGGSPTKLQTYGYRALVTGGYNFIGNFNLEGAAGGAVVKQTVGANENVDLMPTWRVGLTYFPNENVKIGIYNTYTYGKKLTQDDPLTTRGTYMLNDVSLGISFYFL
jgi:hypothetical protein